ncbi:MAG: DUF721 domain-containing protein [Deltaproteobacteria bacterium]|nr:DUF721 domain-containing protein [Deltaproteobacteria bacterium]MBW2339952.1 DUF721 domain-containing protein [Deltaproteobacteria bacterium]
MKRNAKSFTHIKEVIDDLFTTSALPIDLGDARIWKIWDRVVGKEIAEHARPSTINRGILLVKVTDSVWVQELEFMAETIKEKLNSRLRKGTVRKIRFKVGTPQENREITKGKSKQEIRQHPTTEEEKEMSKILARVKDKELRLSLGRFMKVAAKKDNAR